MFNSLKYAKQLEGVGLTRAQAEAHMQIMTEIVETNLATTQDLKDLGRDLRQEMKDLGHELRQEMKDLGHELRREMKEVRAEMVQLEYRLTIKLGTIVSLAIGVAVALSKLV